MAGVVVITGLDQLPPTERWPRFIAPLNSMLNESRVGRLPDVDQLRYEAAGGHPGPIEVAVFLATFGRGRELIRRAIKEADFVPDAHTVPERWRKYPCTDYFESPLAECGYYDEFDFCYIEPFDGVFEQLDLQYLTIGNAGVDGIEWGYRAGHTGIWAYPIDGEFVWLAPTAESLKEGWENGTITV